jgi:membrane-bound metal-dependent hydrolase YbcI (DUF457 family)
MFIGHFALSFAAKRATPRVSLAMLFAAAQFADLLWPALVALGIEQVTIEPGITVVTPLNFISYPYSHSLLMLVIWGALLAFVYRKTTGKRDAFFVLAGLVVSHWVLDFVTHRPDMPLYPGSARFGLGLWNSFGGTVAVEVTMYAAGVWIYLTATRARDGIGRWALWGLIALLFVSYLGNLVSPPPPSVAAIYTLGLIAGALTLVWAWWIDRHREVVGGVRP